MNSISRWGLLNSFSAKTVRTDAVHHSPSTQRLGIRKQGFPSLQPARWIRVGASTSNVTGGCAHPYPPYPFQRILNQISGHNVFRLILFTVLTFLCCSYPGTPTHAASNLQQTVHTLSAFGDRSAGSPGNLQATEYIRSRFEAAAPEQLGSIDFELPVLRQHNAALQVNNTSLPLHFLGYNAITPENLPKKGLTGQLIYAGRGELADFNGKEVQGALVLMEFNSGKNWLNAAALGASALIYINRDINPRAAFLEKEELSPIQFPCFWIEEEQLATILPKDITTLNHPSVTRATLTGQAAWRSAPLNNLYALFPGTDPDLTDQLIVIEAFFDSTSFIPGKSPGADEALSIAGLLSLADQLHNAPPARPFLLLASNGHSQSQAGMRESIWALSSRSKDMRKSKKELKTRRKNAGALLEVLEQFTTGALPAEAGLQMQEALSYSLKLKVDALSTTLMRLRLAEQQDIEQITGLTKERQRLRWLSWQTEFNNLAAQDKTLLRPLVEESSRRYRAIVKETKQQEKMLKSAKRFRSLLTNYEPRALISLHLSSHGTGLGAFHQGFLYPLRPRINRTAAFRDLDSALQNATNGAPVDLPAFISTLRPNRLLPWQDLLPDKPQLAGEVSALAGMPGITLATTEDLRDCWGTPWDTVNRIDWISADKQWQLVTLLLTGVDQAKNLATGYIRNGFSTVTGRTSLLLQGELFAEHPAEHSILLAFQGLVRYHALTDLNGNFLLKGVADKKHVQDKVILEGYRFSETDGSVLWAVDKKLTGKPAYRIKM